MKIMPSWFAMNLKHFLKVFTTESTKQWYIRGQGRDSVTAWENAM